MTDAATISIDERTPHPDPRLNIVGALLATATAALAYVAALSADVLPPEGSAIVLFAVTPALALPALLVIASRARASADQALQWVAAGLAVGVMAMLLQLISFPTVGSGGGVFGTSGSSNAALYVLFHLSFALGALLSGLDVGARWRAAFVGAGVLLALGLALDLVPLPLLLMPGGGYTETLVVTELLLALLTAVGAVAWLVRAGRAARPLHTWVGVALSLSVYDVLLNAVSAQRFDAVWWSSLSMRVATYAVLAVGATVTVLRLLEGWERYTEDELTRRETQLRESLATTQDLLKAATETAQTLESALRPQLVVSPDDVQVAARSRTGDDHQGVGRSWYDTVLLPSGGLALVVGQVEGRDLAAVPVMGLVRGAVRSYALEGHPPSVVLHRVNSFLFSSGVGRTVTVAYAELYPGDRMVTVAVAGHRDPLVVQPGFGSPTSLPSRPGPPLGIRDRAHWDEQTVLLPEGSTLVLCTDGVPVGASRVDVPAQLSNRPEATPAQIAEALLAAGSSADAEVVLAARPTASHRPAAHRTLPVHRMSAGVARAWLADLFALWRHAGLVPDAPFVDERSDVAQLIVTELVSNAARHSDLSVELEAVLSGSTLRLEVSDSSHRMPVLREAGGTDTAGRGLFLVETLSRAWGVELTETGKAVWVELDIQEQELPDDGDFDEDALLAAFSDPDDL